MIRSVQRREMEEPACSEHGQLPLTLQTRQLREVAPDRRARLLPGPHPRL